MKWAEVQSLQQVYKQFHSCREEISKQGVGLNLRKLSGMLEQGLEMTAQVINEQEIKPPHREIKQISGSGHNLFALCEDGTCWEMTATKPWVQLPIVPPYEVAP